jgi:hypothetical protein
MFYISYFLAHLKLIGDLAGKGHITTLDRFLYKGPIPSTAQPVTNATTTKPVANATTTKPATKASTYKPPTKQKRSSSKSIVKRLAAAAANLKPPERSTTLEQRPGSRKEQESVVAASTVQPDLITKTKPQVMTCHCFTFMKSGILK